MTTVLTVLGLIAIVIAVLFVYAMCLAGSRWQPLDDPKSQADAKEEEDHDVF